MFKTLTLASLMLVMAVSASGQEKLSGQIYGGLLTPYNDFNQSDYVGYKRNLALGLGIGYQLSPYFRLRGDLATGLLNGNNAVNYYETDIYEGQLGVDINKEYDGVKINLQGGIGMMMYYARLYDRASSAKVVESPIRGVRSFSPNAIATYGLNIGLPITQKLDFNIGYTNRYVEDVDWMDGQKSGDYSDSYGLIQAGLVFYLKKEKDPSKIELDKKRYNEILASRDSISRALEQEQENGEKLAELEMSNQEKAVKIAQLESQIDTIKINLSKAEVATVKDTKPKFVAADAKTILSDEKYRIVVASLPTEAMAQRWISKSSLDKSEMVVAYIPELNTYRVVYRSYDTFPSARKELLNVKPEVSDAWIAKF